MTKKLADVECYMGPGEWTYRIQEVFDKRLGQLIYELHTTLKATGVSSLVGEYSTRDEARNGMLRYQKLHQEGGG